MSLEIRGQQAAFSIRRALVADDQATVRSALRRLLSEIAHLTLVHEVVRASDLLAQAELTQPDLVLLDWELPGADLQNRPSLLLKLHALRSHPQIIVLSGQPEAGAAALRAGADAFVSKGDPPERLVAILCAMAAKRGPDTDRPKETAMRINNYRKVKAEMVEPGVSVRRLIGESAEAPNVALKLFEIDPEAVSPMYAHAWEDEVFVLRGRGAVRGLQGEFSLSEGDVIYIPSMEQHQFVNRGEDRLCLLMATPIEESVTLASDRAPAN